jgi:hypothetical protein
MSYQLGRQDTMIGHTPGSVGWPNTAYGGRVATAFQGPSSYPSYASAGSGWQTKDEYGRARVTDLKESAVRGLVGMSQGYRGGRRSRSRKQRKSRKVSKKVKGSKGRKTRRSQ